MKNATDIWLTQLLAARAVIDGLPVDETLRATLHRSVAESTVAAEDRAMEQHSHRNAGEKWSEEDRSLMVATLAEIKSPLSWAEEQIIIQLLSERLGRPPRVVKRKAIEWGFGAKVDYWSNREGRP